MILRPETINAFTIRKYRKRMQTPFGKTKIIVFTRLVFSAIDVPRNTAKWPKNKYSIPQNREKSVRFNFDEYIFAYDRKHICSLDGKIFRKKDASKFQL